METAQPAGGPTVLRRLLGAQLRRLRERQGITREEAGYAIRASGSKMSRLELGRVGFKERDVADLLTLYGVTDDTDRETLLGLAQDANSPGWFETYVGLEEAAALVRTYEVQFIPGLLQTEEYARAVISLGNSAAPPEEIEQRVSLRTTRQKLLTRGDAPRLWAVVDEAALRRPIGGRDVMRGQIQRLIEAT
ncbi:MAG TPA: helix-turn-helix transcriptional regulator, partial [Streptomyces sp.]|nr:helix-turn-helix transcriptional regulator [Streptomyces sp.]